MPLQSLFWMNSDFIRDNARSMARRLLAAGNETEERLSTAYQCWLLSRPPTEVEKADFARYLRDYQEQLDETSRPPGAGFARLGQYLPNFAGQQ